MDDYKAGKLRERTEKSVHRPLSNGSINKTLKVLAQVLDDGVEYGYLPTNPARGKKRRLNAAKPRRTWLELEEVNALLAASGPHKALIGAMVLAGLRVSEVCALRWSSVDLAGGTLRVEDSKTQAGERSVDLSPMFLGALKLHRLDARYNSPTDYVFASRNGTRRNRSNITPAANSPPDDRGGQQGACEAGKPPIQTGVTNHSLRRTFASL